MWRVLKFKVGSSWRRACHRLVAKLSSFSAGVLSSGVGGDISDMGYLGVEAPEVLSAFKSDARVSDDPEEGGSWRPPVASSANACSPTRNGLVRPGDPS